MIERPIWNERLAAAWKQTSIVWLAGPRRTGKTVLAQSLPDAEFLNCDLPSVAERLRDAESFFRSVKKRFVVFDEVHQLPDPSRLLKIGADEFPRLKILATGSSTLAATGAASPVGMPRSSRCGSGPRACWSPTPPLVDSGCCGDGADRDPEPTPR